MKKKMLFIYNANAGKGKIKTQLSDVIECLCRADYDITIYATQAAREATRMISERGMDYDVITCSGGDGTINEVVSGVLSLPKGQQPEIGYLPMGTVNDFASSLRISKQPLEAAQQIVDGHLYSCDIGSFQDKYFNYIAGFGAFTEVAYQTSQDLKNQVGRVAYFVDALKRIPELRGYDMRVECDNGKVVEGKYIFGMVCNSKSIGGFSLENDKNHMTLDDGLFEVALLRTPSNVLELERVANALLNRDAKNPFVDAMRVKQIQFTCDDEVRWTLDGEDGGYHKDVKICCNRRAIRIFSPKINHRKKKKS